MARVSLIRMTDNYTYTGELVKVTPKSIVVLPPGFSRPIRLLLSAPGHYYNTSYRLRCYYGES